MSLEFKISGAVIALCCVPSIIMAQSAETTKTETSARETTAPAPFPQAQIHYTTRVRSFEEQNRLLQNVVLLGDSITEGFDTEKYLPGRRVINRGIGSDVIGNDAHRDVVLVGRRSCVAAADHPSEF